MSTEGDQQRRPGAPNDTDGKRRLRAVSYPDPYLVTKLPLEGTVNSGVIRLGERMLLGFIHRPYPDGTRVRVVYDEWLFAERLEEEPSGDDGAGQETAGTSKLGTGKQSKGGSRKSTVKQASGESPKGVAERGKDGASSGGESMRTPTNGRERDHRAGAVGHSAKAKSDSAAPEAIERHPAEDQNTSPDSTAPRSAPDDRTPFPDDFSDPERKARGELGDDNDHWTEAFSEDQRD